MTQAANFVKNNKVSAHTQQWHCLQANFAILTKNNIYMSKLLVSVFLFLFSFGVRAQFFYKDIISAKELSADMASYKQKKIHNIKLKSFEDDGELSEGFFCQKKISRDFRTSELFTRSNISGTSLFTAFFNDKGQITSSSDSSVISLSHNTYYYDADGRIKKIVSSVKSSDDDFTNEILEEHIYAYNELGLPVSMTRVKNKYDSTKILFLPDEKNNVSIEKDTKSGSKYYYYYDTKNQLTDVVHANEYRENLVAVYLFEYNAGGEITQMTSTEEGGVNYYVWRYTYEDGLRSIERLFSKDRKLMGSIEYEYN